MPTVTDDNDQSAPTVDVDNAVDPADDPTSEDSPTEETDKALSQEIEESKSREREARKLMDKKAIENKKLKAELAKYKTLADEEDESEEEEEEVSEEDKPVTRKELDDKAWDIANKDAVELYSDDEYKSDVKEGIPKDKALKYAKLRYETMDTSAQEERQKANASGSSTNRDAKAPVTTGISSDHKNDFGIKDETIQKYGHLVEGKK